MTPAAKDLQLVKKEDTTKPEIAGRQKGQFL
jgi:hypothetical protein